MNSSKAIIAALIFCFTSLIPPVCLADESQVDSLLRLAEQANSDKEKVDLLIEAAEAAVDKNEKLRYASLALHLAKDIDYAKAIGKSYFLIAGGYEAYDYDTAIFLYEKSYQYYERADDLKSLTKILNILGLISKNKGEYQKALAFYIDALKIIEEIQDKKLLSMIYNNMGMVYLNSGSYEKAIEYYIKSLEIKEEINDQQGVANTFGNLGNLYLNQKQYNKAIEYYKKANEIFERIGQHEYSANTLHNIGLIHADKKNYQEALKFFNRALEIFNRSNDELGIAITLSNIAGIFTELENYSESLNTSLRADSILLRLDHKAYLANNHIEIGTAYLKLKKYDSAYNYLIRGLKIAKEIGNKQTEVDCYKGLHQYYEEQNKFKEALTFYKKQISLSDSLFNEEVSKRMSDILQSAEIEKREKEKALLQEQIRRKDFENKALIAGAFFLFAFAGYFYNTTQQKKRTNRLLSEQNEEINRKQQQILAINESLQRSQKQLHRVNEKLQILNDGLEQTVRDRTRELQQSHQELDTFLYQSSHALRRPIVNIMGLIQIARIEPDAKNVPSIYDKIDDTAARMDLMLKKLVMVSEINLTEQHFEIIDFNEVIADTIAGMASELLYKKIEFVKDIQPISGFRSDKRLIAIIFQNLLENSINFYSDCDGKKGCIRINVAENTRFLHIDVYDNGMGIPKEMLDQIFDMFHVATTRSKGYGLGLYIVKKAVEKLNGRIEIESKEHEFTHIKIAMPMA